MITIFRRFLPLPIAAYLIAFFTVSVLLFTIVGGWMLLQMNRVTTTAESSRRQAAEQEVAAAVNTVLTKSLAIGIELSEWEESRQQLRDSTYYEYWRNTRALQSSMVPHYVTDIDLYDSKGNVLLQSDSSPMPSRLTNSLQFIHMEQGLPYFYQFAVMTEKGDAMSVIGYVGMRIDFNHALLDLNSFIHTDDKSIAFQAAPQATILTDKILSQLHFTPHAQGETSKLESVMLHTLYGFAALAVVLIIISYFLTSSLLHAPLRTLAQYLEDLRRGHGDISKARLRSGGLCVKEFDLLRSSIINYQLELEEMHSHLDQKNKELWRLAHHDALTGVANRRAYDEDWMRLKELVSGQRISLTVMLIDCDHFKAINDTYGHDTGDRVIRVIAELLRQSMREGDHLYRLGGDEFAVHLVNANIEQSRSLALRFQAELGRFDFKSLGIKEPVRLSIGIANAEGSQPHQLAQLHKQADIAMYQAKRPNNNKIVVYHDSMASNGEALFSNRYITAVYRAIESGEGIELHFQPVLSAYEPSEGFYEILVRLRDERGIIMPINIFPVIESEGLAVEFDYAVLRRIGQALEHGVIPRGTCVSLNIDGSTLMHQDFIKQVSKLLPFITPGCRCLILEITENALISEIEEGGRKLRHLREAGFTIALDDFGSGYSSLRYLANMPVDIIKLDIGMVRDLEGEPSQRIITEHIAQMIRDAGYQLVAEGIESEELLQRILDLGFTHAQGFLIDRPLPSVEAGIELTVDAYPRQQGEALRKAIPG